MFDAQTTELISRAPALEGLDLAALPQRLTDAYATIVATRVRLRRLAPAERALPETTVALLGEMRRLAFTHEALVSALPDRDDRAAAAFVAGAAHHVGILARRTLLELAERSHLGLDSISPEVSATLLLLIAEATADAAEMAKSIVPRSDDPIEGALLDSIRLLAMGALESLLDLDVPTAAQVTTGPPLLVAVRSLHYLCLLGVRDLARQILGRERPIDVAPEDARTLFDRAKALCVEPLVIDGLDGEYATIYPGPLHLASLLSQVARDLLPCALINTPAPAGLDAARWLALMREIARQRPYLWRNHREAVQAGYLESGVSAAISFPTGAGKSALAELKIASALLLGRKVVFLAPTLALVDQTARSLTRTFRGTDVQRERAEESPFDLEALPTISVMTPERCLALLSFDPAVFNDVGLLVFDECHLLHPRDSDGSRRAIDAMLCLLNFTSAVPEADLLLLSAMMQNTEEFAGWIASLTNRPCLPLALTWKPTRQVRGCVIYNTTAIEALRARIREVRAVTRNRNAPAALRRELLVQPYGFFCLRQTWQTNERDDYALLRLLDEVVPLATGTSPRDGTWYLTPNGNQVASAIAAATASQRLKTLLFTQTITLANSATRTLNEVLDAPNCELTAAERQSYDTALDEAGAAEHLYIQVAADGRLRSASACHHGLLLPSERYLHESLFRRPDGIHVLVATSTLAQGMNLPSEVVIIQGDSRFNPDANRLQRLEAHELLNAAGRAGRAGEGSYGFVLVVPSKVVHFDAATNTIAQHWGELQAIFARSDQCLTIDDPLAAVLDEIHQAAGDLSANAKYLVRRLPVGLTDADGDVPTRHFLGRTFGAYRASARADQAWIETRLAAAIAARDRDPDGAEGLTWMEQLAAQAGVPVAAIRALSDWFVRQDLDIALTTVGWRDLVWQWLEQSPENVPLLLRTETLIELFGTAYSQLPDDGARTRYALPVLRRLLAVWMEGATLATLERGFRTPEHRLGKCDRARHFVVRLLPELSYVFGLANQVIRAQPDVADVGNLALETLSACVRDGFGRPEQLALRIVRGSRSGRRAVHRESELIVAYLEQGEARETLPDVIRRVERAVQARQTEE